MSVPPQPPTPIPFINDRPQIMCFIAFLVCTFWTKKMTYSVEFVSVRKASYLLDSVFILWMILIALWCDSIESILAIWYTERQQTYEIDKLFNVWRCCCCCCCYSYLVEISTSFAHAHSIWALETSLKHRFSHWQSHTTYRFFFNSVGLVVYFTYSSRNSTLAIC